MAVDLPETTSKMEGPLVKQFSVFLPNKVGAMLDLVKLLNTQSTHVVALSVSESTDSAIARIIVSDPSRVEKLFGEKNVAFGVCEVVIVEMREVATQLAKLLAALVMAEVNVHFAYPLLTRPRGFAAIALHVDDTECASSVLMGEGFKILSQSDISRWSGSHQQIRRARPLATAEPVQGEGGPGAPTIMIMSGRIPPPRVDRFGEARLQKCASTALCEVFSHALLRPTQVLASGSA
jgi:hypothetical protein